ncbi:response regulator [Marivirga atlantica]|jgi:CheY-like chemotaxis protein|uniref:Response regulator n=1 Tax=Marivirga atlantica TaxID=1548457 RepID=A0A937DJ08_9BACT|nr:response regulator [Marivirga atlantica]MBL0764721.1 response regulator [Marivirga atlantica]
MLKQINCVLLVDDDEATNFINQMVIEESCCAEKIVVRESGFEALEYLTSTENGEHPQPDLIFLDINMPGMDGFEFLEEYEKLTTEQKGKHVVVMLTTSVNPDDKDRAAKFKEVDQFMHKPLTSEMFVEVMEKHFPTIMSSRN